MHKNSPQSACDWPRVALAAAAVYLFYPVAAIAQAESAGDIFCNVFYNSGSIPTLLSVIAYVAGGAIFIRGMFDLIKRSSDPNKPLKDGLLAIIIGAFIVTLPWFVEWLHNTIYGRGAANYNNPFSCISGPGQNPAAGPVPLDEMLMNFVENIKGPIMSLISILCVVTGCALIFWNMVRLSKFGADAKSNTLTPILGNLVIGALLMAVGQTLDVSLGTLFGEGATQDGVTQYESIAYSPGGSFDTTRFDNAMRAVFIFLYIIGALSFVRGFLILRNFLDGQGQATKGQAFTHIIAGTLLVNMPAFIQVIERTMGFNIINTT
jgi:type IV secretory pathway VirB2 component (pilin)